MCLFNEYFEEEILNDLGETYSYNNLSGAERKSIDFACLFTFMDVRRLQGDVSINVSFYDELLDTSLDEKGIELVLNILKERIEKYNESMFVISHRKEAAKFATGEVVYIELRSGISRRVEYSNI
jgi:DNA repair exonuclease SbcCD ATPase subunit